MNILKHWTAASILAVNPSVCHHTSRRTKQQEQPSALRGNCRKMAEMAITSLYVDSVDNNKLVEDAIRGMLSKLDPHSTYATAKESKAQR